MQADQSGESGGRMRSLGHLGARGPAAYAAGLTQQAAEAVEALFGPWEAQLETALDELAALQRSLQAQARRLTGLERELAQIAPDRGRECVADVA